MSYTAAFASATCKVAGFENTEAAALAVYDYLVNHPDEIPSALNDYDSDDFVFAIQSYLDLHGDNLVISYSTESEGNYDSEVFDFLSSHFACLQTSPFMTVTWGVNDSRSGYDTGTTYWDRTGKQIDVEALLTAHLS